MLGVDSMDGDKREINVFAHLFTPDVDLHTIQHAGEGKPHLFVRLSSDAFNLARQKFGDTCHFGRGMPRELVKSWTYLQEG